MLHYSATRMGMAWRTPMLRDPPVIRSSYKTSTRSLMRQKTGYPLGKATLIWLSMLAAFVMFYVLQGGAASAAELSGVISNRVGLPLSNVKVIIRDANGKVVRTVTTDKN